MSLIGVAGLVLLVERLGVLGGDHDGYPFLAQVPQHCLEVLRSGGSDGCGGT
jgi:hypothetical protein